MNFSAQEFCIEKSHAGLNNLPKDARSRLGTLADGGPADPKARSTRHWPEWVDDEVLSQARHPDPSPLLR